MELRDAVRNVLLTRQEVNASRRLNISRDFSGLGEFWCHCAVVSSYRDMPVFLCVLRRDSSWKLDGIHSFVHHIFERIRRFNPISTRIDSEASHDDAEARLENKERSKRQAKSEIESSAGANFTAECSQFSIRVKIRARYSRMQ